MSADTMLHLVDGRRSRQFELQDRPPTLRAFPRKPRRRWRFRVLGKAFGDADSIRSWLAPTPGTRKDKVLAVPSRGGDPRSEHSREPLSNDAARR